MNDTDTHKIGIGKSAAYGALEVGVSSVESYLRLFLLIFYTDRVGINPKWAGFAVAIGVLWDAVMDPIVGALCDKTTSKYGKRIPWLFFASPIFSASIIFMFCIPSGLSDTQKILWLLVSNILVNTSMAAISIPHLAMGSDLTEQSDQRTKLYAWRMVMSIVGLFVGIAIPAILTACGVASAENAVYSSISLATVSLLLSFVTIGFFAKGIKEKSDLHSIETHQANNQGDLVSGTSFKDFLFFRNFVFLLIGYGVATFGQGLNSSLALYYYKYALKFAESQLQVTLLVFMAILVLSLPLWVAASRMFPKERLLAVGIGLLGILTAVAYPIIPAGRMDYAMAVGGLGGVFLGCIALFESHLTDMTANFGLHSSHNGKIFGIWKFLTKSMRALAIVLSGNLLSIFGYSSIGTPNQDTIEKITLAFGPGVGVFFILGAISLWNAKPNRKIAP